MKDPIPLFYETEIEWTGERKGRLCSSNLPALDVSAPPEFQGQAGIWTPEHLYVASVVSCFMTTFLAIAELSKLEILSFSASAKGRLEKVEGPGYQVTEILLRPKVVVRWPTDMERANRILRKAEKNCFISKSIKTSVKLEAQIYHRQQPVSPGPKIEEPTGC